VIFEISTTLDVIWKEISSQAVPVMKSATNEKYHVNSHLKKNHFIAGEDIDIHLKLTNLSSKELKVKVDLWQSIEINTSHFASKDLADVKLGTGYIFSNPNLTSLTLSSKESDVPIVFRIRVPLPDSSDDGMTSII
jgi:hypothetical protein